MLDTFLPHTPVLLSELLALCAPLRQLSRPAGAGAAEAMPLLVDCTVGGGGHAAALLEALPEACLLGIDRDGEAVRAAQARLRPYGARAQVVQGRFSQLPDLLRVHGGPRPPVLILADFGVSSHQLDAGRRGFSLRSDGPLDMRMDGEAPGTAAELLRRLDAPGLARALFELGEEPQARRIARAILAAPPATTGELRARIVAAVGAGPRGRPGRDPATRTFQALRMLVNEELEEIEALLTHAPAALAPGGILACISFHSLEDRRVKRRLRALSCACRCPPRVPVCRCPPQAGWRSCGRPFWAAGAGEVARNPRARSARLRAAQRLAA